MQDTQPTIDERSFDKAYVYACSGTREEKWAMRQEESSSRYIFLQRVIHYLGIHFLSLYVG